MQLQLGIVMAVAACHGPSLDSSTISVAPCAEDCLSIVEIWENAGLSSFIYSRTKNATHVAAIGLLLMLLGLLPANAGPTPQEYVEYVGGAAKIVPPGKLNLDGYTMRCGHRPTVIDNKLDDYGAAYPGFIILNMALLRKVSTPVKLWIYSHECSHQFRGPDENTADCFAVQRGRRRKWLTPNGLDQICKFIKPASGSMMHLSGSQRCASMRKCYKTRRVY